MNDVEQPCYRCGEMVIINPTEALKDFKGNFEGTTDDSPKEVICEDCYEEVQEIERKEMEDEQWKD